MGEHNEREKPKIYESIAPETRFVFIATSILENIGQDLPESNGAIKIARWPKNQNEHHFKLQASMGTGMLGEPKILFLLDHFAPDRPANVPKNRYQVYSSANGISSIKILDGKNVEKQMNNAERKEAIKFILSALTEVSPEEAAKFLQETFDHHFESLVGVYALSDMAIKSPPVPLDDDLLQDIYVEYDQKLEKIKQNELSKAKKRKSSVVDRSIKLPQPDYYEAVAEACEEGRKGPTNKNSYSAIDVYVAMVRAAKAMNRKWRNTITPETGTYPAPPEA